MGRKYQTAREIIRRNAEGKRLSKRKKQKVEICCLGVYIKAPGPRWRRSGQRKGAGVRFLELSKKQVRDALSSAQGHPSEHMKTEGKILLE